MNIYFVHAFIYLSAAVIAVPIAKRLGLGSVLGYLIAGVIIGPVMGIVGRETEDLRHFAEFGVVMMLFLVGLELDPKKLWNMRRRLLGLGGLQIALTVSIITGVGILVFGLTWKESLAIGLTLSLSSTAIVLQTLNEKGLSKTLAGENSFLILLFQDIAVIPMLALIPLLASSNLMEAGKHLGDDHGHSSNLIAHLSGFEQAGIIILAISLVIGIGYFLLPKLLKIIANSGLREMFTASALMLVIGITVLMNFIGLSPALGTFLAGIVLATSEFRHELEATIEPFKGLLLGLFFITVGAGIDFNVLSSNLGLVLLLTALVLIIKASVLYFISTTFKSFDSDRWLLSLGLAQAGEFGFVLLGLCSQQNVISSEIVSILSLVIALSMFLTPILFIIFEKKVVPFYERYNEDNNLTREADQIDEQGRVIIAGAGRFGQIVNRFLNANNVKTVVLDHEIAQVENMANINIKTYFGDATRPDLLHTAGISDADAIVIAIDDKDRAVELTQYLNHTYPTLKIIARAYDRGHGYALKNNGASIVISETYFSALEMAKETLNTIGTHPFEAEQLKNIFYEVENGESEALFKEWKKSQNQYGSSFQEMFMLLEESLSRAMQYDKNYHLHKSDRHWTPPPKGYDEHYND